MEVSILVLVAACTGAFFMAFNNGANDVANAFASAVGSKAITIKQALFIASTLNIVGAVLLGSHVASTLIEGVLTSGITIAPEEYMTGMICCLLASGTFVLFSTLTGMPVSSTHAIVGSMTGVGIILGGFSAVNWSIFIIIVASWVLSPLIASFFAFSSIKLIKQFVHNSQEPKIHRRMRAVVPSFIAGSIAILTLSILSASHWDFSFTASISIALFVATITYLTIRRLLKYWCQFATQNVKGVESVFKKLQVGTCCYVSFAHGSNDVSNSISPVLAIFFVMNTGAVPTAIGNTDIPIWILLLGACGMGLGVWILGHKVMATLGRKITLLTNSKGFCVDFATATTVVLASVMGMPVSSTHAATGSIIGVGLESKRSGGLNLNLLGKIFMAWIITVPSAALLTMGFYSLAKAIFL